MCLSASDTVPRQVFRSFGHGKENVDVVAANISFMNFLLLERKQ
jgi:hypothetical protein